MREYIITDKQLKTATEAYLEHELSRPITDVFVSGDKLPYRGVTQREIAELQEQVYELQAALDLISISLALPMTSKPITPDMRKPEVLAKLIIETIKKLANEREHYRSKFSRALGYADDIHALMDDEGMA